MTSYTHFIGLDVAKHTLDAALRQWREGMLHTARWHGRNSLEGHRTLARWLTRHTEQATTVICMENTGPYDDALLEHLTLLGWICAVEKTTILEKVRPEHHRKDDAFDAAYLAEYADRFSDCLHLYQAPNPQIEQIRLLYRERRRLVTHLASVKQLQGEHRYNHRRQANTAEVLTQQLWQQQRRFYQEQIRTLEAQMQALINEDEELRHRYEQVKAVDGIGPTTAMLWVCLFYGQPQLNARRIASRFGVAPHGEHSGTSVRRPARSTGHGMREMRKLLTMCARSAGTHHAKYQRYKARKLAEGKRSKVVTNNIINKLLRVVCAVWNADAEFDRAHVSRFVQNVATST